MSSPSFDFFDACLALPRHFLITIPFFLEPCRVWSRALAAKELYHNFPTINTIMDSDWCNRLLPNAPWSEYVIGLYMKLNSMWGWYFPGMLLRLLNHFSCSFVLYHTTLGQLPIPLIKSGLREAIREISKSNHNREIRRQFNGSR